MALLTRRTFFAAGGGLVALGVAAFGGSFVACNREWLALRLDRLDVALSDIRAADRIAHAWRARETREATETALLDEPDLVAALRLECDDTRRARLRERFRADFASGAVEVVDRWVLSHTECRIAALRAA